MTAVLQRCLDNRFVHWLLQAKRLPLLYAVTVLTAIFYHYNAAWTPIWLVLTFFFETLQHASLKYDVRTAFYLQAQETDEPNLNFRKVEDYEFRFEMFLAMSYGLKNYKWFAVSPTLIESWLHNGQYGDIITPEFVQANNDKAWKIITNSFTPIDTFKY